MEAILSSETSVNTTSIRCHIPEDCFLQELNGFNLRLQHYTLTKILIYFFLC
jgi:hypothetical protein